MTRRKRQGKIPVHVANRRREMLKGALESPRVASEGRKLEDL